MTKKAWPALLGIFLGKVGKYILGTTVLAKNFQICKIEEVFTDDAWKSVGKLGKDGSCTLQKTRFMLYPFFLKFKWYKYLV